MTECSFSRFMYYLRIMIILVLVVLINGCSKNVSESEIDPPDALNESYPKLTVGLMSAVDAAPFFYAEQQGFYEDAGVTVELVLFTNGQHRQTALQTGQVDGIMTDLVALIIQSTSDFSLRGTMSTDGIFPLLSSHELPSSGSISIGTMEISVTNYVVDAYLENKLDVQKVFINEIPARLEAVVSNQLDAGVFPEPFASIGVLRGLKRFYSPEILPESVNIMAFTSTAINEKSESIQRFHNAYARAVEELQANSDVARDVLIHTIPQLPQETRDSILLPEYHYPRLPSENFTKEIIRWTENLTSQSYPVTMEELFDNRFIRGL